MSTNSVLSPGVIYEMFAKVGFKKYFHVGGFEATRELTDLCQINRHQYVLDIGCASGKTACYLARTIGCTVVGVDLLPGMVERASERAQEEGVEDRVEFRVGDAQDLPFEDALFDVVLGEFITGLVPDKHKALGEYLRVAKPGGIVGLNEATWLKTPPPEEVTAYLSQTFGFNGQLLDAAGWQHLLESAGLRDLVVTTHKADALSNPKDDIGDVLSALPKVLYETATNPTFRQLLRESFSIPKDLLDYFGYGLYVGKKQK